MLASVDVFYDAATAYSAAVIFKTWSDAKPLSLYTHRTPTDADYIPGRFYLRELGPVAAVLEKTGEELSCVIIDGYVAFGAGRPGLGRYLFEHLGRRVAVVGVAKRKFLSAECGTAIIRGKSKQPLYITSAGMTEQTAAQFIAGMHGKWRIPTMLKFADQLSKNPDITPG